MKRCPEATTGALLLLALLLSGAPAPAQPPGSTCPTEAESVELLEAGIFELRGRFPQLERAEESLCRAACCLPPPWEPGAEITLSGGVIDYQVPFYFLGRLHLDDERPCSALKSFALSECVDEMGREGARARYEPTLTKERGRARRLRARSLEEELGVAREPPHYRRALEILGSEADDAQERAEKAAPLLWKAIEAWDEDGEETRIQGRFLDRYLPRHHLARALLELRCWEAAEAVAACSHLGRCLARSDILERARTNRANGEPEGEGCAAWRRRIRWSGCTDCLRCLDR